MVAYGGATRVAIAAVIATLSLPLPSAVAEWSAEISRELGKLKVTVWGDVEGGRAIYATCDTARNALLALLVPSTDPSLTATGMTLSFAFADGSRWTSRTSLYRYDNDLVAVGYSNANDVPAIVAALARARDDVQIGLTGATGQARTWMADTDGSTAAARKFLDNCFNTN
jgi:hypothetical protein